MLRQNFNRRHSPNRRRTRVPATVRADGRDLEAFVLDVSYEGMRLSIREPLAPGTAVTIRTLDVSVRAIIHWSREGHAGAHLLDRLERDVLVALETADDDLADFR